MLFPTDRKWQTTCLQALAKLQSQLTVTNQVDDIEEFEEVEDERN